MMQPTSPTMAEVARSIGVSIATVSLALRNDPRISAATKERVKKAAKKLHYQPDPMLTALTARRGPNRNRHVTANIAALVDDRWMTVSKEWAAKLLRYLTETSDRLGYTLNILYIERDLLSNSQPDRLLGDRGIRGLVILPILNEDIMRFELDWSRYSIIALGVRPLKYNFNRVSSDAFAAMSVICNKLYELGYRRIGLAHDASVEKAMRHEWLGALAKEYFIKPTRLKVLRPHLPMQFSAKDYIAWIKREKPDCVISNDIHAFKFLREAGYRIPEDIGIALLSPSHTTPLEIAGARPHLQYIASTVIEQLHGMLMRSERGIPEVVKEVFIYPLWVNGTTVRQAP